MQKHFGPRLKLLHCRTDQAITCALAEMDLTAAQGHIMGYLSHRSAPPCPRDLEEAFHLSHPTVSGLLSRLEKKEFIQLRPDPNDKRCKRIYILEKGEACNQRIRDAIQVIEHQLIQGFSAEEQAMFTRLLDRAIDNMGGIPHCTDKED